MAFEDFDIEIQDERDSLPEQFNGDVTTAGSPITLTPTSTKDIQLALVKNPRRGPNSNGINDVLYITIDGSANIQTVDRGESIYFSGVFTSLKVDSNNNGTNYEIIIWS